MENPNNQLPPERSSLSAVFGFLLLLASAAVFKLAANVVVSFYWPTKTVPFIVAFSFLFCLWVMAKVISAAIISELTYVNKQSASTTHQQKS